MEFFSYLIILGCIILVALTVYATVNLISGRVENNQDLVDFIFEKSLELFEVISEDYRGESFESVLDTFVELLSNVIKSSNLPKNLKELASKENISLLSKPIIEFLYNKKFGKTRLIELRKVTYSEEEELILIQQEMRFLFDRIITKK